MGKLAIKANKGILVGFESSNNFLVYIPTLNKVINTRDVLIKEDLEYKEEYKSKENNNTLEEIEEELEAIKNLEINSSNTSNSPNIIEENTELEGVDSDIDELNSEFYSSNNTSTRSSKRIRGEIPEENLGFSIYKLAS